MHYDHHNSFSLWLNNQPTPRSQSIRTKSQFSLGSAFDPFYSEVLNSRPIYRRSYTLSIFDTHGIHITENTVHPLFILPCGVNDVLNSLRIIPHENLHSLKGIHILGGTNKQLKCARGSLAKYGCYYNSRIYLFAYPKRDLDVSFRRPPHLDVLNDFRMCGARITYHRFVSIHINKHALRRFYMYNVLFHEIGHHLESGLGQRSTRCSESFARHFVDVVTSNKRRNRVAR